MRPKGKQQSERLTTQQKASDGALGIFDEIAQRHDKAVQNISIATMARLQKEFPKLEFRYRNELSKQEINKALQKIDGSLGQGLFVSSARIKPDGGIIEVKDDNGNWRVVLVSEAKYQGKDIENIKKGKLVGKNNDQILMAAGNAIERAHKNIREIANFMLIETYFPYIIFLAGSNFLTKDITIKRPDGNVYTISYDDGTLNRLDRLTAANYGMPINTNLCENKFVSVNGVNIMLQAASIYTRGDGEQWEDEDMIEIMLDVAKTSLRMMGKDLFNQLTK
ncbi:MAG: hypothetical protein IJU31_04075 [Synergistaceae bacterium]|nr:hypothetical protein [Synergistaceae bacterium]